MYLILISFFLYFKKPRKRRIFSSAWCWSFWVLSFLEAESSFSLIGGVGTRKCDIFSTKWFVQAFHVKGRSKTDKIIPRGLGDIFQQILPSRLLPQLLTLYPLYKYLFRSSIRKKSKLISRFCCLSTPQETPFDLISCSFFLHRVLAD